LGVKINSQSTWSKIPFHGLPDIWHLPTLQTLRQHTLLYSAFSQILKTPHVVVSIDRICMKPPRTTPLNENEDPNADLTVHTDSNLFYDNPIVGQFQCGLCLQDAPKGNGGFYCVPGYHLPDKIKEYKEAYKNKKFGDLKVPGWGKWFNDYVYTETVRNKKIEIPLEIGDAVIWNNYLPHNGGTNTLKSWRLQVFVRFLSLDGPCIDKETAQWHNEVYSKVVKDCVEKGVRPTHYPTRNLVKGKVTKKLDQPVPQYVKPELTWLGERVFGVVPWDGEKNEKNETGEKKRNRNKRI